MQEGDERYYSMSITSFGPSTLLQREKPALETRKINDTSDIEGATRTTTLHERFGNKPMFAQTDVAGSAPKALTHARNCRDNSLYVDDIEGTRAKALDKMATTRRRVNPLEPDYPLPSYIPVEPHEPKFLRHTMDITDIDGTATQPLKRQVYAPRDSYRVDDIVGAQPNWKPRHERVRHERDPKDIMEIGDISRKTHRWVDRTARQSDPVAPVYHVNGMDYYDDPRHTKPAKPKPFIPENMLLVTKDIMSGLGYPMYRPRRDYARTNFCGDIDGAMPDTIKHAIVTNRRTNPLAPTYQGLDFGDPLPPLLVPLIPATLVPSPTIRPKLAPEDTDMRPKESISKMGDTSSAGAAISGHGGPTADYHWSYKTFREFAGHQPSGGGRHGNNHDSYHGGHGAATGGSAARHVSNQDNAATGGGGGMPSYTDYYSSTAGGDDDPVLFTAPSGDGTARAAKPPLGPSGRDHKIKLDLDVHAGRAAQQGGGSARGPSTGASPAATGRGGSGNRALGPSPRPGTLGATGPLVSGRGSALPPMGSARAKSATGGDLRAARELQAEIDAVRAL